MTTLTRENAARRAFEVAETDPELKVLIPIPDVTNAIRTILKWVQTRRISVKLSSINTSPTFDYWEFCPSDPAATPPSATQRESLRGAFERA